MRTPSVTIVLLAACAPPAWLVGASLAGELAALPQRIEAVRTTPPAAREMESLSWGGVVPRLRRAAELLAPLRDAGRPLPVTVAYVAAGLERRNPAVRGACALLYLTAPGAWVVGAPLERLEEALRDRRPPGPVLQAVERASVLIVAGEPPSAARRLRELARARYGTDVLKPGFSDGAALHVLLRHDLAARLAAGDPEVSALRGLMAR